MLNEIREKKADVIQGINYIEEALDILNRQKKQLEEEQEYLRGFIYENGGALYCIKNGFGIPPLTTWR